MDFWLGSEISILNYGSTVRKIMCTTNTTERVNASFCKATKKSSVPNEDTVFKSSTFES